MPSELPPSSSEDPILNQIIAQYLEDSEAGNAPDRDDLLTQHPEHAESLKAFFANHDEMRGKRQQSRPRSLRRGMGRSPRFRHSKTPVSRMPRSHLRIRMRRLLVPRYATSVTMNCSKRLLAGVWESSTRRGRQAESHRRSEDDFGWAIGAEKKTSSGFMRKPKRRRNLTTRESCRYSKSVSMGASTTSRWD